MRALLRATLCGAAAVALTCAPVAAAQADEAGSAIGGARMGEHGPIDDPSAGPLPQLTAASWLVADADTGAVLAAFDPHRLARPASTQKTLLALTMAPRLDPGGSYRADVADTAVEGTRVGLVAGQTYSLDNLWYGLFLRSGNDAANAIAKAGADRDVAKAVRMMQAEAHRLQADDTTVVNPSGLDADGQFSSAYDLALWGRAALGRGDLRHYFGTLRHDFPGDQTQTGTAASRKSFAMYTQNRLINRYPGAIGVKAGYTTLAHNTLIAAATQNGHTILATLTSTPADVAGQAKILLDWGFAHLNAPAVGQLVAPLSAAVLSGEDAGPPLVLPANPQITAVAAVGAPSADGQHHFPVAAGIAGAGLLVVGLGLRWLRRVRAGREPDPVT
ncbi:MAG TPA: D-alanyl-D-alanine carboxypeptidase [Sporichthyaceae bacterium]|nr:D-alanyl-D-alanine carboxypeptidase [Sporichthyaceae bacterium]